MTTVEDATERVPDQDERLAKIGLARRVAIRPEFGAILGAIIVYIVFWTFATGDFNTVGGAARFLDPASTLGIMAVAVSLLMIGGEFDLSAGVITGSSGILMALLVAEAGWNLWLSMAVALVFALLVGFLNGLLVIKTSLPSFIVTLGTFFILRGLNVGVTRLATDNIRVSGIDEAAGFTAARTIFNGELDMFGQTFRVSLIWWIALTIVATWVLLRTRAGNWVFSVGGDVNAARSVGVPANRVKVLLFMTTAGAGWLVGMMNALRLRGVAAGEGVGQEFVFIIAAVIGGCLLTGGYGSAIGAAIGALIFGMIRTGITFAGWDTDWFFAFLGGLLLAAVLLNNFVRAKAAEVGR